MTKQIRRIQKRERNKIRMRSQSKTMNIIQSNAVNLFFYGPIENIFVIIKISQNQHMQKLYLLEINDFLMFLTRCV